MKVHIPENKIIQMLQKLKDTSKHKKDNVKVLTIFMWFIDICYQGFTSRTVLSTDVYIWHVREVKKRITVHQKTF